MKITKLDTGVTAIELDPNKKYMFIVDHGDFEPEQISMEHGTILYKEKGQEIQIVEQ